ncbi:MAG: arginyl-tRNA synthetase [Saprospiraceae bacterium]|jgi:arginyl-tRNA synthetase
MNIISTLQNEVAAAIKALYGQDFEAEKVSVSGTRKGVDGDYTVTVFSFAKIARKAPPMIAEELGKHLQDNLDIVSSYDVAKGFLNLYISNSYWTNFLADTLDNSNYGFAPSNGRKVLVEFSSPNTNKPLHLGHIRNNLLGWSTAKIVEAAGYDVTTTQVINDRGVHICKSMLAWQMFGNGETPESTSMKGDHFVGKYYVIFNNKLNAEYAEWQQTDEAKTLFENWVAETDVEKIVAKIKDDNKKASFDAESHFFKNIYKNKYFNINSKLGIEVNNMLLKWEANDTDVRALWAKMNSWVYAGFGQTYEQLGVSFEKNYYESETYLFGKDKIEAGLKNGVFYQKEDSSVWIDLEDKKLDHKLVLRSNGTSVYITQDIGMAYNRTADYKMEKMVYVVGDEQDYHFSALFATLGALGLPNYDGFHHLSYGMVDLPTGRMKSREGTVVDADDLMDEVINLAISESQERGTLSDLEEVEKLQLLTKIGLGALKYFMLRINPKRRMTFDPKKSLDLQGQTGPYIQNAYVRTRSVKRKAGGFDGSIAVNYTLQPLEKDLLIMIQQFPETIQIAAQNYDPSEIASYAYNLAKTYHKFYHDLPIFRNVESEEAKAFRLQMNEIVGQTLKTACGLLGIDMPEYM